MKHFRSIALCLATLLLAIAWRPLAAVGQQDSIEQSQSVAAPDINELIKAVEEDASLDPQLKEKLLEDYNNARKLFGSAKDWSEKAVAFKEEGKSAPGKLEEYQAKLAEPVTPIVVEPPPDADLKKLQQLLGDAEAMVKSAQDRAAAIDEERNGRSERRKVLRSEIDRIKVQLEGLPAKITPVEGDAASTTAARELILQATRRDAESQLAALEAELEGFGLRGDLLEVQRDLLSRDISAGEKIVEQWREIVRVQRESDETEAARKAQDARQEMMKEAVVATEAVTNALIAEQRAERKLSERIAAANKQEEKLRVELADQESLSDRLQSKVNKAGLTQAMGQILRRHMDDLPDLRDHRRNIGYRKKEITTFEVELIDLESNRADVRNIDQCIREILSDPNTPAVPEERLEDVTAALKTLLLARREMLDPIIGDYNLYVNKLADLNVLEGKLIDATEQAYDFINERILWVRSAGLPSRQDVANARDAIEWLFNPDNLILIGPTAWWTILLSPVQATLVIVGLIALIVAKPHLSRTLDDIAVQTRRSNCQRFFFSLRAVWCTLLDAAPWPAVLLFGGWLLGSRVDAPLYCKDISGTMTELAWTWLFLAFLRRACSQNGLGPAHFSWNEKSSAALRSLLTWAMLWILPVAFASTIFMKMPNDLWHSSLGRYLSVLTHLGIAAALFRFLRPNGPVMRQARAATPQGWPARRRFVLLVLGVWAPVALALASIYGYHYTVDLISLQLWWSTILITSLILVRDLALRWLLVSRRHVLIEEYRTRKAANQGDEHAAEQQEEDPEAAAARLATISDQGIRLVRSGLLLVGLIGLYWTWTDMVPALSLLDKISLWTTEQQVLQDGILTATRIPVTIADLAAMLLAVTLTTVAARNLPGLLEITALVRLPLKHGERYAISTVTRYVILIVGGAVSFRQIGIGWANIQWMAAAITVGLGFGLQEIFANFVSGLILLFERPIRVGDTVSVGENEGIISQIQMRATTMVDWNRKEIIIPNREFVTGRIVNWSLKDPTLRAAVPVGVAYGSDAEKVRYVLLQCARAQPGVLTDPEPQALFLGFGDSALSFELRVFISLESHSPLMTKNDLHFKIAKAFAEADIEIAFPQRDLHIRSLPEGTTSPPAGWPASADPPHTPQA